MTPAPETAIAQVIRSRRTPHVFHGEVPPRERILEALSLARWAPNHRLTEPWRFYLLGPETADAIARLNAKIVRETRGEAAAQAKLDRWRSMPGWLLVTCRRSTDDLRMEEDYAACCCAVQNIMLALWAHGIGMKWGTGKVTHHPAFFDLVGVDPMAEKVVGLFWYGYPDKLSTPPRKPLEAVLYERP